MAPLTYNDILTLLSIIAVGMAIILLYHMVFVAVNLRRLSGRIEEITAQLEKVIIKPLQALESGIDWLSSAMAGMAHRRSAKKGGKKKSTGFVDTEVK